MKRSKGKRRKVQIVLVGRGADHCEMNVDRGATYSGFADEGPLSLTMFIMQSSDETALKAAAGFVVFSRITIDQTATPTQVLRSLGFYPPTHYALVDPLSCSEVCTSLGCGKIKMGPPLAPRIPIAQTLRRTKKGKLRAIIIPK